MRKLPATFLIALLLYVAGNANAQLALDRNYQKQMPMTDLFSMPLAFTENQGQFDARVIFRSNSGGATFFFCRNEVEYSFLRNTYETIDSVGQIDYAAMPIEEITPQFRKESTLIRVKFVGANPNPEIIGVNCLPYNNNYFYGNNSSKWRTAVPNFSAIVYKNIYAGIDLKYYGNGKTLKYDFIVNPGVDISRIAIKYEGVDEVKIDSDGNLQLNTTFGFVYEKKPFVYQNFDGRVIEIKAEYYLKEPGLVGFDVGEFDLDYPLIIDPELLFSTYIGGNGTDEVRAIDLDDQGNIYISGITGSSNFPLQNPYDDSANGNYDIFVAKFAPSGDSLLYSTYIGGNNIDLNHGMAIDASGSVFVTGETRSDNFPTINGYDLSYNNLMDVYVTKLSPEGNSLVYSTFLGGYLDDRGYDIAVDDMGNAYITGSTTSWDFPLENPYDSAFVNWADAFVTKLAPSGNSLVFSTYLGGDENAERGYSIAVDAVAEVYITGITSSIDFPVLNPYCDTVSGLYDVFVTKMSGTGNSLIYSSYLGGSEDDWSYGIVVDSSKNAYIAGHSESSDFPLENAIDSTFEAVQEIIVTKFSTAGDSLIFSTFLGGNGGDGARDIAIDESENIYLTGYTSSTDFPVINAFDENLGSYADVFVTEMTSNGDSLVFSTYLGGDDYIEIGYCIDVDIEGNVLVGGNTESDDFPTINAFDDSYNYGAWGDGFLCKFGPPPIGRCCYGDTLCVDTTEVECSILNGVWDENLNCIDNPCPTGCDYVVGDVNGSDSYNGLDITYGVNYLKGGSNPMCPFGSCPISPCDAFFYCGDVNGSCSYNGLDITYGVNYLKGGDTPTPCPDCPPAD